MATDAGDAGCGHPSCCRRAGPQPEPTDTLPPRQALIDLALAVLATLGAAALAQALALPAAGVVLAAVAGLAVALALVSRRRRPHDGSAPPPSA